MTRHEIIHRVKELNLLEGSYIVFGSCPLTVAGIREAKDIDLLVSEEVFAELQKAGWQKIYKDPKDEPLTHDIFEAHPNWDFSPYSPTLKQLLTTATIIDGIPFASLQEVRKWKLASGGSKHLTDVKLIDVLEIIRRQPGIRPSELNRTLGFEHSASVRNKLVKQDLIRKVRRGRAVLYYPV